MGMAVLALQRTVAGRVAIHTTRMLDHLARFREEGHGALLLAMSGRKLARRLEPPSMLRPGRRHSQSRDHDRHRGSKACREHSHFRPPPVFAVERVKGSL